MGNGALTLVVTLMAADAWLVKASPDKSKYAINFISVALENKIQLEVYQNLMISIKNEIARKSVSLYIPFYQVSWIDNLTPYLGAWSSLV